MDTSTINLEHLELMTELQETEWMTKIDDGDLVLLRAIHITYRATALRNRYLSLSWQPEQESGGSSEEKKMKVWSFVVLTNKGSVMPAQLWRGSFTVGVLDNLYHNPCSGTDIVSCLIQFPTWFSFLPDLMREKSRWLGLPLVIQ